jgi:hypothetical protein
MANTKGIPSVPDVPPTLTLEDVQRIIDPLARIISIRQGQFDPLDRWVTQQDLIDAGLQTVKAVESPIPITPDTVGGSPGGSDGEVQYSNAGEFDGIAELIWDGTNLVFDATNANQLIIVEGFEMGSSAQSDKCQLLPVINGQDIAISCSATGHSGVQFKDYVGSTHGWLHASANGVTFYNDSGNTIMWYIDNATNSFWSYHNTFDVTKTISAATGGLTVKNDLTGGGYERVLTTSDLALGGGAGISGTPADNQVGVWVNASDLEGTTGLTYNGTTLAVTNTVDATTLIGNTITEKTGGSGVTVDGLLIKDSGIPEGAVTAHEAALSITLSQLSDFPQATTTELEDNTDVINTGAAKVLGYAVLNITTGVTVFAAGSGDSDVWDYYDATTAHTPV